MKENLHDKNILLRAQGCLLGQLAGDALGSLVEFRTPEDIRRQYPKGVRELSDGGTWNTVAGQPTDDSEMALLLARMLADQGRYDPDEAKRPMSPGWTQVPLTAVIPSPAACGGAPIRTVRPTAR